VCSLTVERNSGDARAFAPSSENQTCAPKCSLGRWKQGALGRPFAVNGPYKAGVKLGRVVGRGSVRAAQFLKQRLCLLQVGSVEALGEPVVMTKQRMGFVRAAGGTQQSVISWRL
jgi:hypothetical protein